MEDDVLNDDVNLNDEIELHDVVEEVPSEDQTSGEDVQQMEITYKVPDNIWMYVSQIFSWTFFLVMLGELAYGEAEKKKILEFWTR